MQAENIQDSDRSLVFMYDIESEEYKVDSKKDGVWSGRKSIALKSDLQSLCYAHGVTDTKNFKITGTSQNQLYFCFGVHSASESGDYMSIIFKQRNNNNIGCVWNKGKQSLMCTFESNTYSINVDTGSQYAGVDIISSKPFSISK